uniref:Uncharacterized protein n=1 Tax=Zea mays TaxID=4577 RepID=C4IZN7_MAIZE|nr:unknown [Zea mays]ACR34452.1 unknown [Zea mays]
MYLQICNVQFSCNTNIPFHPDVEGIHCCLKRQVQNHFPWDDQTCNWNQICMCHSLHSTHRVAVQGALGTPYLWSSQRH